jgi:hypothetical protein
MPLLEFIQGHSLTASRQARNTGSGSLLRGLSSRSTRARSTAIMSDSMIS